MWGQGERLLAWHSAFDSVRCGLVCALLPTKNCYRALRRRWLGATSLHGVCVQNHRLREVVWHMLRRIEERLLVVVSQSKSLRFWHTTGNCIGADVYPVEACKSVLESCECDKGMGLGPCLKDKSDSNTQSVRFRYTICCFGNMGGEVAQFSRCACTHALC